MQTSLDFDGIDTMMVGQGYNGVSCEAGGSSVIYAGKGDLTTTNEAEQTVDGAGTSPFQMEIVESLSSIKRRLNVSAGATLELGVFNGESSASFIRNKEFNEFNVYLMLDVRIARAAKFLKRSLLTDAAKSRMNDLSSFLDYAGNQFVYGYQEGGRLTALLKFSSNYTRDFEETKQAVKASLEEFGKGKADLQTFFTGVTNRVTMKTFVLRKGLLGAVPAFNELIAAAQQFPAEIANMASPPVTQLFLRNYSVVEDFDTKIIDRFRIERQMRSLEAIAGYLDKLYEEQGRLGFIKQHNDLFVDGAQLISATDDAYQANEELISTMIEAAAECRKSGDAKPPAAPKINTVPATRKEGASSVTVKKEQSRVENVVVLFEHEGFRGRSFTINETVSDLGNSGFNDTASSVVLNGGINQFTAEFYMHANFNTLLFVLHSPSSSKSGTDMPAESKTCVDYNDSISSVRITKNY